MLTEQLTTDQMKELLQTLFGFDLINVDENEGGEHWVVYDEEGNEFYGSSVNCQFDFSTLAGFFSYTAHRAKNQGFSDCQFQIKKLLGLNGR